MSAEQLPGRRVVHGGAYGYAVFSRPPARTPHAQWSHEFEIRALLQGYTAVINGQVIDPGTDGARAEIVNLKGVTP